MPVALPLTNRISQGASVKKMNKTKSVQLGDGYSQEAPDGINSVREEWNIAFENLTSTERTTLVAALDAVGTWDYLTWTPPNSGSSKRFKVIDGYSENFVSGDLSSISVTLRQTY